MNFEKARFNMVEQQVRPWDVLDFDVLDALSAIPREAFVSEAQKPYAYADKTLPLPNGGSMLEPKIVARMVQGLDLLPADKVLEIGTGSGYATALLCEMAGEVTTIDIDAEQQARAQKVLGSLGYDVVEMVLADQEGWDRYEAAKWLTMRRWLEANPNDDFAGEVRAYLTHGPKRYVTYTREYLGWGVFALMAR